MVNMLASKSMQFRFESGGPCHWAVTCPKGNFQFRESRTARHYGDSFGKSFIEYGMTMPCIRLEDKLQRVKNLVRNGSAAVNDESIDDTLLDLANYAIMTLIERGYGE